MTVLGRRWRSAAAVGVVVALALFATSCGTAERAAELAVEHRDVAAFYRVPDPLPAGEPGTIIRKERILGAPEGAIAWRVLYHSRDIEGRDIPASGVVVAPNASARSGSRPVVAWGHPTTGTVARCAPSRGIDPFILMEGLYGLLADGYVVTAADYPGMGVEGPSSYLIGTAEANSMLDLARAARKIREADAGDRLLLWGHSQGGHAALFAAQQVREYAPDLHLVAIAVAAPAAELAELLKDDIGNISGVSLGSYAFSAYEDAFGAGQPGDELTTILSPAGAAATPKMAALCLFGQNKALHAIAKPLVGRYLTGDPAQVEPWRTWLQDNTPGAKPLGVPVFVAQGTDDDLVHPTTTDAYVARLCAQREQVFYDRIAHTGHALVALKARPDVRAWFSDLLAGRRVTTNCRPEA